MATAECTTLNVADITSADTGPGPLARTVQWCIRYQHNVWAEILLPNQCQVADSHLPRGKVDSIGHSAPQHEST